MQLNWFQSCLKNKIEENWNPKKKRRTFCKKMQKRTAPIFYKLQPDYHIGGGSGTEAAAFAGDFINNSIEAVVNVTIPAFCKACFRVITCLSVFLFCDMLFSFFIFVNFKYSTFTILITNNKFYRFMLNLVLNINKVNTWGIPCNIYLIQIL